MLGPDSRLLTALLITASIGLLVATVRLRLIPVKVICGALSIMVAMTGGIAAVNYYYGYYTTWGQLWADFHSSTGNLGTITAATASTSAVESGRIGWTTLSGKLSGYSRPALVYLPPQYGQARYAQVRFPVVELFHGSPGSPLAWASVLKINQVANSLLAKHLIGPMVLVMPSINGSGHNYQDCVNGPSLYDETYLTQDVRADVLARYRVSRDSYEWGLAGYSSGGYCAANIALRHPSSYGAAAIINGYFRAADGPAGAALNNSLTLEDANSPLYLAEKLPANASPLPPFWVAAGTHDTADYKPATVFVNALDRIEQVPFARLNAGDTANAWEAALPAALTWMWQQLAPPGLRVMFPTRSQGFDLTTLPVQPVKTHLSPCKLTSRSHLLCVTPRYSPAKLAGTKAAG
ncbi:MAG TPA: alpha/beta hydrolase-fold protein [Trebonia sp.]|nr:alpha/beta hydrolase-fold protein [Trebonia sp.]